MEFSVHGTDGSATGPDPENRVGDQEARSRGRPVSFGCNSPVSRGVFIQERHTLVNLHGRFSLKNPSIAPAEISNIPR